MTTVIILLNASNINFMNNVLMQHAQREQFAETVTV